MEALRFGKLLQAAVHKVELWLGRALSNVKRTTKDIADLKQQIYYFTHEEITLSLSIYIDIQSAADTALLFAFV